MPLHGAEGLPVARRDPMPVPSSPLRLLVLLGVAFGGVQGADSPLMDIGSDTHPTPPMLAEDGSLQLEWDIQDLRLGATMVAVPNIRETVTRADGTTADYTWNGHRTVGGGPDLTYITRLGSGHHWWRHILWGVEVQYAYTNTTPTTYGVNGGTVQNTANLALSMQFANLDGIVGWASAPEPTRWGAWDVEALLVAGGGMLWADTEGFTAQNQPTSARGYGVSWNVAPRLGFVLAEDQYLMGLHADWVTTTGHVNINLADSHSRLTERRSAPAGTFEIGYRF